MGNMVRSRLWVVFLVCLFLGLMFNLHSFVGILSLSNFLMKLNPKILVNPEHNNSGSLEHKRPQHNVTKHIVLLNAAGWMLKALYHPHYEQLFSNCEVKNCDLTRDQHLVNTSDAVIFYGMGKHIPKKTKDGQVWIFAMWESPYHSYTQNFNNPKLYNQFNWTMTYRLDSDIPVPYGLVTKIKPVKKNYDAVLKKKKKLIAWVVSHCKTPSKRENYVAIINKTIPVDSFGKCSGKRPKDIFNTINETYKFYLSFENSLCKDYVTEKFFERQNLNVVPIVRGDGNYKHFYPKNSYIDTNDFKSVDELTKYLLYLDKNNAEYTKYLKAKEGYHSETVDLTMSMRQGYCDMCRKLHSADKYQHIYHNVQEWFSKDVCRQATDLNITQTTVKKLS